MRKMFVSILFATATVASSAVAAEKPTGLAACELVPDRQLIQACERAYFEDRLAENDEILKVIENTIEDLQWQLLDLLEPSQGV